MRTIYSAYARLFAFARGQLQLSLGCVLSSGFNSQDDDDGSPQLPPSSHRCLCLRLYDIQLVASTLMKLNLTLFVYLFCVRFHLFIRQKSVNSIKGSTDRVRQEQEGEGKEGGGGERKSNWRVVVVINPSLLGSSEKHEICRPIAKGSKSSYPSPFSSPFSSPFPSPFPSLPPLTINIVCAGGAQQFKHFQ